MGDYVRDLELELLRAARARHQRRLFGSRRRGARVPTVIAGVLSAATVAAVFVVAIGVIGHGAPQPGGLAGVSPAARGLASKLGVLRRPQTAADRSMPAWLVNRLEHPQPAVGQFAGPVLVPGLTRLAATLPGDRRIFVIVQAPRITASSKRGQTAASLGDQVSTIAVSTGGAGGGGGGVPASELYRNLQPATQGGYMVSVVPDSSWTSNGCSRGDTTLTRGFIRGR